MSRVVIQTDAGPAWVDIDHPTLGGGPPGAIDRAGRREKLLVLGHGAGGGVDAPDLLAVRDACLTRGVSVARVTQPYRVAGRKAPPAAASLDRAWLDVIAGLDGELSSQFGPSGQLVFGGRSSGARVACRAAVDDGAIRRPVAVVALAFPVHPPGKPEKSRLDELNAVTVPVLVVQGSSDPFGMPGRRRGRTVRAVAGDHSLRASAPEVGRFVAAWIAKLA